MTAVAIATIVSIIACAFLTLTTIAYIRSKYRVERAARVVRLRLIAIGIAERAKEKNK